MACREELPLFLTPMLARAGDPPTGDAYAAELKLDGIRLQVRVDRGELCARTRPGRDCTDEFAESLAGLRETLRDRRVILDGELVCLDAADGRPDFEALRAQLGARRRRASRRPVTFFAFDLLHLDGRAVRQLPYAERRRLLAELGLAGRGFATLPFYVGDTEAVLAAAAEHELEGIVVKRLDSIYVPGTRSAAWVKHKLRRDEQFLVTAWTPGGDGELDTFFLARRTRDGELARAGSVRYGFDGDARERLRERMLAAELPASTRRRVRRISAPVEVTISTHGHRGGIVRDAVLREVM
jgi:bifunctional non-homologous end joining protein LigD